MKVILLNGNPVPSNSKFDQYLSSLSQKLQEDKHKVRILTLRDMKMGYCKGCFDCWVKTPGLCIVKDDTYHICDECINSDLLIFASPLIMGFTSALLKKANDKLIPLILYHVELVDNEYHHIARYPKYPFTALLLGKEEDTDSEDIEIVTEIYRRDAINFKTEFRFTKFINDPIEEVVHEINHI